MKLFQLLSLLLVLPSLLLSQNFLSNKKFKLPKEITETSGLFAKSADSLLWLNDSGNAPELYRTNTAGDLLEKIPIPNSQNRDWEDLTADRQGRIFIGDFGNNANRRQDLCIYIWEEEKGALDSIRFRYPDQEAFPPASVEDWTFDMEGFFYHQDSLHLFSKDKTREHSFITKHYVLPAQPGTYTATLKRRIELPKRVVTGAAISPDGRAVVLLAYRFKMVLGIFPLTPADIFLFQNYTGNDFLAGEMTRVKGVRCFWPTQYEAIDFINTGQVLIGSERTPLYHQKAKRISIPLIEPEP